MNRNTKLDEFITEELAKITKPNEFVRSGVHARLYDLLKDEDEAHWTIDARVSDDDFGDMIAEAGEE